MSARIFVPSVAAIDWSAVGQDARVPLVVTNRPSHALQLCLAGQPAIAVLGASKRAVRRWLLKQQAHVIDKATAH